MPEATDPVVPPGLDAGASPDDEAGGRHLRSEATGQKVRRRPVPVRGRVPGRTLFHVGPFAG